MIRLENKNRDVLTYIPAYILTFFFDYVNKKNIKAEIYGTDRYIKSAFFILKNIYGDDLI